MLFRSFLGSSVTSFVVGALLLLGKTPSADAKEYVIKLRNHQGFTQDLRQLQKNHQVKVLDTHFVGSLVLVDLQEKNQAQLVRQLASLHGDRDIDYLVPNISLHLFDAPNDPLYAQQWALQKVQAEAAWKINRGSKGVTVAVIDTGVAWEHEDLKDHIKVNEQEIAGNGIDDDGNGFIDDIHGWDFKDNDNNPNDETSDKNPGHGTHCSGIIGAVGDNNLGVSGIAAVVSLLPIRFLGADGSGDLFTAAKAIDYAVAMKVDVISASWGAEVPRDQVKPILEAVERAGQQNIIFVAAAANAGKSNDSAEFYPANAGLPNVISVAASDPQDGKPVWSNFGRVKVDLAAPGLDILSTLPLNKYGKLSGTSMATPLVAGSVALVLAQAHATEKTLSPTAVKALLQASAATVKIETACHCRIDVGAALGALQSNSVVVVPNAGTFDKSATHQFAGFGGTPPYTYVSSKPAVATISTTGMLTAVADGETAVTITDSQGKTAASRSLFVGKPATPPGNPGKCPLNPPALCDIFCKINPQLPWCSK